MFKRRTRQGFTLVECLFSLLILALLFEATVLTLQSYQRWIKAAETDHGLEWQNFVMVFEAELNHFQVQQVGLDYLDLVDRQDDKKTYRIVLNKQRLYKQPGYQPYLYQVAEWRLAQSGESLRVEVSFSNGQVYQTYFWLRPRQDESGP